MSHMFDNGTIYLVRGDTFEFDVVLNKGSNIAPDFFALDKDDELHFYIHTPDQPYEEALVHNVYPRSSMTQIGWKCLDCGRVFYSGDSCTERCSQCLLPIYKVTIKLSPRDSARLDSRKYYYQVKVRQHRNEVYQETESLLNPFEQYTIVPKTQLFILD